MPEMPLLLTIRFYFVLFSAIYLPICGFFNANFLYFSKSRLTVRVYLICLIGPPEILGITNL